MRRFGPMSFVVVVAIAFLSSVLVPPVSAQGRGATEFGLDGMIAGRLFDDSFQGTPISTDDAFLVGVPLQIFRVGFYVSDRIELEPSTSFTLVSLGGDTAHELGLNLNLLSHLSSQPGKAAPYVRLGGGLLSLDGGGGSSVTQFHANGGFGVKIPTGDRWAVRLEAAISRNFANDDFLGSWDVSALYGFSFFTR
jgi:hypothetical protein